MFPQTKIGGTAIAWGKGKWNELEDGEFGYTFDENDSFNYAVHREFLNQHGVQDDDLFDCIEQIEDQLGAPEAHRPAMGLIPNQGLTNAGITVRSRTNDKVMCSFTPTSLPDQSTDGYFQWFLDPATLEVGNMTDWMAQFDRMSGNRVVNIVASPTVPSYQEACQRTSALGLTESVRERFLQKVWNYHKNVAPGYRGYRARLESEINSEWAQLTESNDEVPKKVIKLFDTASEPTILEKPFDVEAEFGDYSVVSTEPGAGGFGKKWYYLMNNRDPKKPCIRLSGTDWLRNKSIVAMKHAVAARGESVEVDLDESDKEWLKRIVTNPATGNKVQIGSLPPEEREKYRPKASAQAKAARDQKRHAKKVQQHVAANQHDTAKRLTKLRAQARMAAARGEATEAVEEPRPFDEVGLPELKKALQKYGYTVDVNGDEYTIEKGGKEVTIFEIDREATEDGTFDVTLAAPAEWLEKDVHVSLDWKGQKSSDVAELVSLLKRMFATMSESDEMTEADPSLQPPKRWFNSMLKKVQGDDKAAIVGAIWRDLSDEKKSEIRAREGKTYGPAESAR